MEKFYKINDFNNISLELKEKLKNISENKLFIAEEKLKQHLTENEILELLNEGVLDDKTLE